MSRVFQKQPQPRNSAAQAGPLRPAGGLALMHHAVFWLCAVLCAPPAHAGRTDSDWMAPAVRAPLIDARGGLARLDAGQPAQPGHVLAAGPGAARAAIVADMRIATHAEAQALLQGGGLLAGADAGADTATLSALLDRLRTTLPSPARLTPRMHGTANAVNAVNGDLDCALFAESVRVRRLLGAGDVHKPAESAGPASAMGLDVPIRCLAAVTRAESPAPARPAPPAAADRFAQSAGLLRKPAIETWVRAYSDWLVMLAASAGLTSVLGLAVRARARERATTGHQWR